MCKRSKELNGLDQIGLFVGVGSVATFVWDFNLSGYPVKPADIAMGIYGLRLGPHATIGGVLRMVDGMFIAAIVNY